jgi:FtsH-binding integral membrane protein
MYISNIFKNQEIMEKFYKVLGVILFFLPSVVFIIAGEGPVDIEYSISFIILFIISVLYHVWLIKKHNFKLPKDIKDTHSW